MDFLSRLGARAVGAPSSVKPIIPPLFLTRTPIRAVPAGEGLDEQVPLPGLRTAEGAVRPRPEGPDTTMEESHGPGKAHLQPRVEDQVVPKRRDPEFESARVSLTIEPSYATGSAAQGEMRRPSSIERLTDKTARTVSGAAPAGRPQPASATSAQRGDVYQRGAELESEPASAMLTAFESAPLVPRSATLSDVAAALERLRALRETVTAPRPRRDPVVRVTIGRIEVRSVPAAAPEPVVATPPAPQPGRALPPRVTLADYLARKRSAR
jgi:hypothetical protein